MSAKDVQGYSILRAVNLMASGRWHVENSVEREASEAYAKVIGRDPRGERGFLIPPDVLNAGMRGGSFRAAQRTSNDGAGGYLVPDDFRADSFIDLLRNRLAIYNQGRGATVLSNLRGDVIIPKKTVGTVGYWVAEGTGIDGLVTKSDMTFAQIAMRPKTCGAATEISRKLMLQSSPDAELLVRNDLLQTLTTALDAAFLGGNTDGTGVQPTGILNWASVGRVDGGSDAAALDWDAIVDLETAVAAGNADVGSLAYMTNAVGRGEMKTIARVASTDSKFLLNDDGTLNGYPLIVSNQVSGAITQGNVTTAYGLIFGNWADCVIGLWSGVDVMVNPYANDLAGATRITIMQDADFAVRNAASFAWRACARTA
jgi:HK97 family phage major capsid protein